MVELLFKILKEKKKNLLQSLLQTHVHTGAVTLLAFKSTHTIFSAVNCEASCLSLLLASLSIMFCLLKWSFSSCSSSTLHWRSLFSSSSTSAFSSKCLKIKTNQADWEQNLNKSGKLQKRPEKTIAFIIKKESSIWVFYLRCEFSSLSFFWRTLVISSVFSFKWHRFFFKTCKWRRKIPTKVIFIANRWWKKDPEVNLPTNSLFCSSTCTSSSCFCLCSSETCSFSSGRTCRSH